MTAYHMAGTTVWRRASAAPVGRVRSNVERVAGLPRHLWFATFRTWSAVWVTPHGAGRVRIVWFWQLAVSLRWGRDDGDGAAGVVQRGVAHRAAHGPVCGVVVVVAHDEQACPH